MENYAVTYMKFELQVDEHNIFPKSLPVLPKIWLFKRNIVRRKLF